MFKSDPLLERPEDSRLMCWRYLADNRLLDLLTTGELFFTHLRVLEDQNEGALTERSRERLSDFYQHQNRSSRLLAYQQVAEYQEYRREFYVSCWHMNSHESYLMWKAYAPKRGFAIRSTFERLQASFDDTPLIVGGGQVRYVDFARDFIPVGNTFNHVCTKDLPYTDEREFRLVFWNTDPRNIDHPKNPKGLRVPARLDMLIHSVVRSPYAPPIEPEMERLLLQHGLQLHSSSVLVPVPRTLQADPP